MILLIKFGNLFISYQYSCRAPW